MMAKRRKFITEPNGPGREPALWPVVLPLGPSALRPGDRPGSDVAIARQEILTNRVTTLCFIPITRKTF